MNAPMAISRRVFLRLAAAGVAVTALPASACSTAPETAPPGSFFTDPEWRALGALADAVLPPDAAPGGSALGAATYIDTLCRAFDSDPPLIHAGGPFSGRQPFANPTGGTPSGNFPENEFSTFVPLSRVADRGWRLRIFGSAGVPGGGPNDAITGPIVGLRDTMKNGLAAAMALSAQPIETLDADALQTLMSKLDPAWVTTFAELVVEAALAAPEYGGNGQLAGWTLIHYGGDVQPLGYSVFDTNVNDYVERVPVSTGDPGPDVDPMDDDTNATLTLYTNLLNGRIAT